jgi:hypothetical protein
VAQQGLTTRQLAENLKWLAVNVLGQFNQPNPALAELQEGLNLGYSDAPVDFDLHTGLVNSSQVTPVDDCRRGTAVRVEPTSASSEQVYLKAVDLAVKLEYDELRLDYYTDGRTLITVSSSSSTSRRRLNTYYDDQLVHPNRLVHVVKDASVYAAIESRPVDSSGGVHFEPEDDYSEIQALMDDMSLFSSLDEALDTAKALGFGPNPFLSGGARNTSQAGTVLNVGEQALSLLSSAIKCPQQKRNQKLFPVTGHPAHRTLSDVSQLDDSSSQDVTPYTMRTNNPLGVPVVKGVTDLKTRFGFLGESKGKAVYRDHVGGAAAGLAYLQQMGGGATLKGAVQGVLGQALGSLGQGRATADDLTSFTSAGTFSNMSRDLFGKGDPTGTLLGCATLDSGDMDQVIHTAASMAKNLAGGGETNPLTYDEWSSAYQISKNEPNGHLKRTTTGVPLPAQEQQDPQDTGVVTHPQGKETAYTTDYERRGKKEDWNPLSNFQHFAEERWGSNGTKWIQDGLLKYEQKTQETDEDKIAKKAESQQLTQTAENPSTVTLLDWTPTGQS